MRRHKHWPVRTSLTICLAVALGACGGEELSPPGELIISELERDTAPSASAGQQAALIAGNTQFALDAYGELSKAPGNVFYSPLSISTALAMTYGGARGETESQMASVLHYNLPQADLHPAFNWLDLELGRRGQSVAADKAFRLDITNATFGQKGYQFLPDYLDRLALNYGAGVSLLDFATDTEGARKSINDWVARATDDRISDLIPSGVLTPLTRLVLTNAVYFKAAWKTPFNRAYTADRTFHAATGDLTTAMMTGAIESMGYTEASGYQAVSIPYAGDQLDMVLIMPAEDNFATFEASLDAATLGTIFDSLGPSQYGALTMPKFEFRFKANLVEMFQSLGMTAPFKDGEADFSGMDGSKNLLITSIVHEAFVNVNESGTEASAATAVVVGDRSAPVPLVIDRPFLFLIRDIETGALIFLGRIADPSA